MKKLAVILLALCLLISGVAIAEESASEPAWRFSEFSFGAYVEGTFTGDVTIPNTIDGYYVTSLEYSALSGQNEVTSLTLADSIYALQNASISRMDKLESLTLNNGLEFIGESNISFCPALTSVTIPESVKVVSRSIMYCDNLREVRFLGECPVFVDNYDCFYGLAEDYVIYVPDDQMDAYAAALQDINGAAEHLQPSGQNAIICEEMNTEDWFEFDASTGTITGYVEYHAYVDIPASIGGVPVKAIGESAMYSDPSIYAVEFPEGLERIESEAFSLSNELSYVKFSSTVKTIGEKAFDGIHGTRIDWCEGLVDIGPSAFMDIMCYDIELPSTVETIGASAFESSWVQNLYLSGNLKSIGSRAFADCILNYASLYFYEPIDIAEDAFVGNEHFYDIDLPWDCTFENRAQYAEIIRDQCPDCTVWINNPESAGLAEYPSSDVSISTFEDGVWTVYNGDRPSLSPWYSVEDVIITALGDGLFKGSQTIRSFYPNHCGLFTTIGNEAFADSTLEYFEPFGSIETIGNGAFRNCLNLKELTLPASLTSIGADALAGCDNLETIIVLCDPAILPDGLFDECFARANIYAAPDATDEQLRVLSEKANHPWYAPVCRVGETFVDMTEMPYAMQSIDDYWYDTEYMRLDRYNGYELNLYLPREAEGVWLSTLGGDMMGRARGGDNYEMELPVRSVVIPENYTEIYTTTFAGCETLETVICYAPLEALQSYMFDGCTNLREVVFVNGVRTVDAYAFNGCENLETVYLGKYVEQIDANAFMSDNGSAVFDQNACITDPALMPDLDAMLAAVKSDPMPEPTPEPTPAPAVPVSGEGAAYIGTWAAETLEMDGEVFSVADLGAAMYMTLNADGTAESYDGESSEAGTWTFENGTVIVEGMALTVTEDGKLVMEEDGTKLTFGRTDSASEAPAQPEAPATEPAAEPAAPVSGDGAAYVGTWAAETLEMDGEVYPAADMDAEMYLTLNADGTAELYDGESSEAGTWTFENGTVVVEGMALTVAEDGKLVLDYGDMKLFFVRSDSAPAAPAEPEVPVEPEAPAAESAAPVSGDGAAYVGTWYADTLEMEGEVYPVGEMGLEMYITLNADGTAESYDGESSETGTWTFENGAVVVEGMALTVTEDGRLLMEDEDSKLFFVRSDATPAAPAEPEVPVEPEAPATEPAAPAAPVSGDGAEYVGTWYADTLEMEGEVYPVGEMGLEMYITLNADGTAEFYDGEASESSTWVFENGTINVDGTYLTITEDGKLVLEDEDSKLVFVKSDAAPAAPAEPEVHATEPAAEPVSGDGAAYVGTWAAETLEMDGEVFSVADLGAEMYMTLNADGTAESYDGESSETGTWTFENGAVVVEGMALTVTEDGKLVMEEEGTKLTFGKTDSAPAAPVTEEEGFIGTWYGCYMATGAINGDPREMFEIVLTVNEDGTANLAYPTDEPYHWIENEDGSLTMVKDIDGVEMPLSMLNDGYICYGSMDGDGNALGGYIIFSRDALAIWTPDMLDLSATEPIGEADPATDVPGDFSDRMEIRYVCQSAEANGVTLDASLLGGEYALTFHANGTVDFVMVGNTIPGLKWTQGDGSFVIDYYGNTMEVVLTESGLDMNYFDTMLMHFVPAE